MSAGRFRFPMVLTLATLFNFGDEFVAGGHPSHVDTSKLPVRLALPGVEQYMRDRKDTRPKLKSLVVL